MSDGVKKATWYRPDVTGLRTLAIVPVVAFHAGASFLPGGFIGVDIFYVISGFLITTLLFRELTSTGRIQFGSFWAKRVRRLVPVLVLVVLVTLPLAALLSSVLSWDALAGQAVASVFYVSNILFWRDSTDYFSEAAGLNPFLHTWSLSVEEQFYLLWPVLIFFVGWLAVRSGKVSPRAGLITMFVVVFVASLALSVMLTPRDPSAAFYLLPTRAWEFAAGALLALVGVPRMFAGRRASALLVAGGIAIILVGLVVIRETDPFPGSIALVPVIGTLFVLAGGAAAADGRVNPLTRVLSSKPFVWIGNVSYSWYLWHWPFIVLAAAWLGNDWWITAGAAVASLGAAALTYETVEKRFRFSAGLVASQRKTYVAGLAMCSVAVVAAAGVFAVGSLLSTSPTIAPYAQAAAERPDGVCEDTSYSASGVAVCEMGDLDSETVVVLAGDSHAGQWKDAMAAAAEDAGVMLVVRWKSACPSIVVNVASDGELPERACQDFQVETRQLIEDIQPDGVVLSNAFGYIGKTRDATGAEIRTSEQLALWSSAYESLITTIDGTGADLALIDDNPRVPFDPIECLTTFGETVDSCSITLEDGFADIEAIGSIHDEMVEQFDVDDVFSVGSDICDDEICSVVDDSGEPVFLDETHLAEDWTMNYVPELVALLDDIT